VSDSTPSSAEDDESDRPRPHDNSLGRLFALSDGVFSIAMTLLALDLTVPEIGSHPSDRQLRDELWKHLPNYLGYLISFYVIAIYWQRHRRLMRSVVETHPKLFRDTIFLLAIVAALPFPTALLAEYGSTPIALAIYGGTNVLATLSLVLLAHDIEQYRLAESPNDTNRISLRDPATLHNLFVFLICIPGGYVLGSHGPYLLILLALPARLSLVNRIRRRFTSRGSPG
jgi:uncharacterized membrane protein